MNLRDKVAGIYQRAGTLLVERIDQTDIGHPIGTEDVTRVAGDAPDEVLGAAIIAAASRRQLGVPHPTTAEFRAQAPRHARALGVRHWGEITRDSRMVDLWQDPGGWLALPSRSLGPRRGFADIPGVGPLRSGPDPTPTELGALVRRALALSREFEG